MSTATQKKGGQQLRPFGMLDKVAYAAGDFGCNMSFCLAGTFFTLFYTQYMKIDSLRHSAFCPSPTRRRSSR